MPEKQLRDLFPQDTVESIESQRADGDISQFSGKTSKEIVGKVTKAYNEMSQQDGKYYLDISKASTEEVAALKGAVNDLQSAGIQLVLNGFSNETFDSDSCMESISDTIVRVDLLRESFRRLIIDVIEEKPEDLVDEFNDFAARNPDMTYEELHYWNNLGLADVTNAEKAELRKQVDDLFVEVLETKINDGQSTIGEVLMGPAIGGRFMEHKGIPDAETQVKALLLGMMSNLARGVYYKLINPESLNKASYKLRKKAVQIAEMTINE